MSRRRREMAAAQPPVITKDCSSRLVACLIGDKILLIPVGQDRCWQRMRNAFLVVTFRKAEKRYDDLRP